MDKRTKTKTITTIICMVLSLIALYAFIFVLDVSIGWRIALIVVALGWLADGAMRLTVYFKRK